MLLVLVNIVRVFFIVTSYWRPGICNYYWLLQAIFWAVRETAPIDYGEMEIPFRANTLCLHVLLLSKPKTYNLVIWFFLYSYCTIVIRLMYYNTWDVAPVLFKYIFDCFFWIGALSM